MAVDLKVMLKKVLASAGKKKFFFAYGLGKRKDKKGEGELTVRAKKPKKAEVEAELADPGDIFEGVCWSGGGPDDLGTIYYQSKTKKLSMQTIAKMKLTAKVTVGQQFDFQMPSPAEEARANTLVETESESEGDEAEVTESAPPPLAGTSPTASTIPAPPPLPGRAPTSPTTTGVPPAPPPMPPGKQLPPTAPGKPPSSVGGGGADLVRRLNGLAPAIKAAMAGPDKSRVQTLFVGVNAQIKKSDLAQAEYLLVELEQLVKQNQIPTAPPGPGLSPEAAAEAEWVRRMIAVEPRIMTAQKKRPNEAPWLTHFKSIQSLGTAKRFDEAMAALDQLEALLLGAPPSNPPTPEQPIQNVDEVVEDTQTPSYGDAEQNEVQSEEPLYPDSGDSEIPEAPPYPGEEPSPESEVSETTPDPETTDGESNETESTSQDNQYADAYAGLLATVSEALRRLSALNPDAAAPVQQSVDYAMTYAQGGDYANAYAWLEQASQALANLPPEESGETNESQSDESANDDASAYNTRLRKLESELQQLQTENPEAAAPIQQSIEYAVAFAQSGDYTSALGWLDQAEQELAKVKPGDRQEETPTRELGPKVLYAQARLDWESVKKTVGVDILKLEKAILEDYAGDPVESEVRIKIRKLDEVLKGFDDLLQDKLDEAMNMTDDQKEPLHQEALAIINRYQTYVDGDPFIKDIDANPFIPMSIAKTVTTVLNSLADRLKT